MRAIAFSKEKGGLLIVERPEPSVTADDDVKLRIISVGVCGTDRERIAVRDIKPPEGRRELVIGHENFGQVVEVGKTVTRVRPGDYAAFAIRRGCGECLPCGMGRADMCRTGKYRDRGLSGIDGFQTEFAVDKEEYVIKAPEALREIGVFLEPLSVVEKAIDEVIRVQTARLPDADATPGWLAGKRALVAGLGSIGLLAALALRLRGAEVYGLDVVEPDSARAKWLEAIGGRYIDGRKVAPEKVGEAIGPVDVIVEAAGTPSLAFNILDALGRDGAYVMTGLPEGEGAVKVHGAELMRDLVKNNQIVFGTVSSAPAHYRMAVADLERAETEWPGHVSRLITDRYVLDTDVNAAFLEHPEDEIKAVFEWAKAA